MEDRHYLSEPRPVEGLDLPTWQVDIYREGVDTPIMTLTLDSNHLPPRKRKKKVVWKLPDSFEIVPKFGMEDKKRILEIFKQQKKELKKQKRRLSTVINPDETNMTNGNGNGNGNGAHHPPGSFLEGKIAPFASDTNTDDSSIGPPPPPPPTKAAAESAMSAAPPGFAKMSLEDKTEQLEPPSRPPPTLPPKAKIKPVIGDGHANHKKPEPPEATAQHLPPEPYQKLPPGVVPPPQKQKLNFKSKSKAGASPLALAMRLKQPTKPKPAPPPPKKAQPPPQKQTVKPKVVTAAALPPPIIRQPPISAPLPLPPPQARHQPQPPKRHSSYSPPPPDIPPGIPPGILPPPPQTAQQQEHQQRQSSPHAPPPPGMAGSAPPPPPPPPQPQRQQIPLPPPPGHHNMNPGPPLPPPPQYRQFLVPPQSTLAQVVTETYYLLLTRGLIQELGQYYSPTAQKSLTVGSAHAFCHTPHDKLLQLQSLVGMVVQIKGVLQQPTSGHGTLVLITGTCVQPHSLPFCHSLVMIPTPGSNGSGFSIQNDALCFLTTEDAPSALQAALS